MTVAIGIVCTDGVIVASDSMGSSGMRASIAKKVYCLSTLPIAWSAAGAVYTIEECESALKSLEAQIVADASAQEAWLRPDRQLIRQNVGNFLRNTMRQCYQSMLGGMQPSADFLVVGWSNSAPWFLEFAGDGQMNWHEDTRFYAVGSGGDFASVAQGLMAHYFEGDDLDVENGLRVAYRTIETTCQVSSQFVGLPVQLAKVTANGAEILSREEVEEVAVAVDRWRALERETLSRLKEGDVLPLPLDTEPLPTMEQ